MWSSYRDQPQWGRLDGQLVLVVSIDKQDDVEWAEYIDDNGKRHACNLTKLKPENYD